MPYLKLFILLAFLTIAAHSMLIYRHKQHRPKLVCYAVPSESSSPQQSKPNKETSTESSAITDPEQKIRVRTPSSTTNDLAATQLMSRARRNADDFEEVNFSNGFDIDIIGASLSSKNQDKIRKKLIQTCESLNIRPVL